MGKVFLSATGAKVVIASNDHCPPHLHAGHKEEGWVVKLWFSYASSAAGVLQIAPTEGAVRQRQLNTMIAEVVENIAACRKLWWEGKRITCLENKWMVRVAPDLMEVSSGPHRKARQVLAASYDIENHKTVLEYRDGSEDEIEFEDGGDDHGQHH